MPSCRSIWDADNRVPHKLFITYAVLLRERTSDEDTARIFLDVASRKWDPKWVAQWLKVTPRGRTRDDIWAFYDEFCAVLNKQVELTPNVSCEQHVKRGFGKKIFYDLRWDMAPIVSILTDPSYNVLHEMAEFHQVPHDSPDCDLLKRPAQLAQLFTNAVCGFQLGPLHAPPASTSDSELQQLTPMKWCRDVLQELVTLPEEVQARVLRPIWAEVGALSARQSR
ncbi:hypothetical protein H9P43_006804 [Blastocladiella emersonii ATCC 22665]|nr:hypothetical protein H9P43_006804 [Blastocladiella emersonii ATCC 22665]